jgi:hypothetical protein
MVWITGKEFGFGAPEYLWLLLVPAALLPICIWKAARWRGDVRLLRSARTVPTLDHFAPLGSWPFWLGLSLALTLAIAAVARPQGRVARLRTAGVDVVVLQDGSASMHVRDVAVTRWQRSMRFLRTFAESLDWNDDRMALALFATIAAPQVRLTRDPNTFFFFIDHLSEESPFPLKDSTTWDTNIELGVRWGLRLIARDAELNGPSPNAKAFVLVSDGQAWSGEVARALADARAQDVPVFVVGIGSPAGGYIPEPVLEPGDPPLGGPAIHSRLDRPSLVAIATAGRAAYHEIGREPDASIANAIVGAVRRRAGSRGVEQAVDELYWYFLFAAACCVGLGGLFLRGVTEVALQAVVAAASLLVVWNLVSS